jgi:hypothetical protein
MSEAARKTDEGVMGTVEDVSDEKRAEARYTLLIQPAKIIEGKREIPCVLRDVSEQGVSVRSFFPLPDKGDLEIELLNGERFAIDPVWHEERSAGFHFKDKVDVSKILSGEGNYPKRPIRLSLRVPAVVLSGVKRIPVKLENISQQGAKVFCEDELAVGQMVILRSDTIPKVHCKVRWRRGNQYGLVFEQTFKLPELAELVVKVQSTFAFLKAD